LQAHVGHLIVYVIDDDDSVRTALARLMRSAGLEPRPYGNPAQFLADLRDEDNGVILLDLSGRTQPVADLLSALHARGIDLPVIALSADDNDEARESARDAGARLFLHKPVDKQALLDAIHWVAERATPG